MLFLAVGGKFAKFAARHSILIVATIGQRCFLAIVWGRFLGGLGCALLLQYKIERDLGSELITSTRIVCHLAW